MCVLFLCMWAFCLYEMKIVGQSYFSYALPTLTFYVMIQSLFSRIGDLQYFLEIIVDEFVSDSDYLYARAIDLGGELVSQELQSGE